MIPRNPHTGTNSTVLSACFADPALVALDNMMTSEQRRAGAFGAVLALLERASPQWHRDAACRGSGLDFTNIKSAKNRSKCLQVCGRCDVRAECLSWAIEVDDRDAVLGGMDPAARRRLARNRMSIDGDADG